MKRLLIALFAVAALTVAVSVYAFDLNLKKKSCETACDASYNECLKKAEVEDEKEKNEAKQLAQKKSCEAAKDECYKKCKK